MFGTVSAVEVDIVNLRPTRSNLLDISKRLSGPMLSPTMNAVLDAGSVQSCAVAVPGPDFGENLPSPIPMNLILDQKTLFKAGNYTFYFYALNLVRMF